MQCVVKNSKYRMKLQQSGISEPLFESFVMDFMDKYGRFPNLDEIPRANSTQHLKDTLHITGGAANIEDILASTNTTNIIDANIALNDQYTDQDIRLFPLNNTALVYTDRRPSPYVQIQREPQQITKNPNPRTVFTNMFDKFRNQYGINIHTITDKELEQWNDIPEVKTVSAFVHNSEIYINTDLADIDAPIHEMTHILLGSIRFKNPELYYQLVQTANQFEHFDERLAQYPNMAKEDAYEEIFVEEVGRYLSGLNSAISNLPINIQYELHYNIKRLLDTALMGQYSVKSIRNEQLYKMTLPELVKVVNSMMLQPFHATGLDDASMHRMLANTKSELIKNGDLEENCQ